MKTVIINGSPFKNSHTAIMMNALIDELEGEIKLYHAYDMDVAACKDCKYCFHKSGCSIKDDMVELFRDLESADVFVIASPMHFGIVSAPLFTVATRLQRYWAYKNGKRETPDVIRPKVGCMLMTTGGQWVNMELLADGVAHFIFDHTYTKNLGSVYAYMTDLNPVKNQADVLADVKEMAQRLKVHAKVLS